MNVVNIQLIVIEGIDLKSCDWFAVIRTFTCSLKMMEILLALLTK